MAKAQKLYTLTEVGEETGISMPTLQRYKKLYQDRIPSEGEGRKQRYPRAALAVFKKLREENLKKRGRRSQSATAAKPASKRRAKGQAKAKAKGKTKAKAKGKTKAKAKTKTKAKAKAKATSASRKSKKPARQKKAKSKAASRKKSAGRAGSGSGDQKLLTLLEIGRRTGISYPTLLRYVKLHGDEIPHVGSGRRRRFPVAAVKEFRRLRRASKRGPRAGKKRAAASTRRGSATDQALKARVRELERAQKQVTKQLDEIVRLLKKPMRITVRSD